MERWRSPTPIGLAEPPKLETPGDDVAAEAEAEKTLAVALSNPAAADALRSKRAERAGVELADELASASEEVFEDARDAEESDDDNW